MNQQCGNHLLIIDHACNVTQAVQNRYVHLHTVNNIRADLAGSHWAGSRRC